MDASILLAPGFTKLQKKPCLDQRRQQPTGVELNYRGGGRCAASGYETIWVSEVSNMNWPGWSIF